MTRLQHAQRIVNGISAEIRGNLYLAPLNALKELGIVVLDVPKMTSSRNAGGLCDGLSFSKQNTILYAPTESRRKNFTLLHEYAHLRVDRDEDALNWLADEAAPKVQLELLCNDIAAALLIPDHILDGIVGDGPILGQHLLDLFLQTDASQIACAIGLSRRLSCDGAIVLTDRNTHTVAYVSLVGEPYIYPGTNQVVPDGHPLRTIKPGEQFSLKSFWTTPWGAHSPYYINAAASEKRTYSVFAEIDLWRISAFHQPMPTKERRTRPKGEISCHCGFKGLASGWPCETCGRQYCPRCNSCDCDRQALLAKTCQKCFLQVPKVDLVEGICSGCR